MTRRQTRLAALGLVMAGLCISVALALSALQKNVTFFYSPSDLIGADARYDIPERPFRLGGIVTYGSVIHKNGVLKFTVTDHKQTLKVVYQGFPPDLFAEGQGVVASGQMAGVKDELYFRASQLLAKHDENYMPPEVKSAVERVQKK